MTNYKIFKVPYLTEKTNYLKDNEDKVTFKVTRETNKKEVKKSIEKVFKVTVEKINILNQVGKKKRMGKYQGKKANWKKAVITLKKGDKIELFEGA